jgi:putative transposase
VGACSAVAAVVFGAGIVDWAVSVDSTIKPRAPATRRTCPATQGDLSNYRNLQVKSPDHGIGRARDGLSTKIHALTDGKGRPRVLLIAPGQGGDAPMLTHLMRQLRTERVGPGRA